MAGSGNSQLLEFVAMAAAEVEFRAIAQNDRVFAVKERLQFRDAIWKRVFLLPGLL